MEMDKKIEFEKYIFLILAPFFFVVSINGLTANEIKLNPIILTGWQKNGFVIGINLIFFCLFNRSLNDIRDMSSGLLTKNIILKKIIFSPFFIMFIMMFSYYWEFIPIYYNKYFFIFLIILYYYTGYRFVRKIENDIFDN